MSKPASGHTRFLSVVVLGSALAAAVLTRGSDVGVTLEAQSNCNTAANPIVCENLKPGDPSSQWDISGAGDPTIQGFPTAISVTVGQTQTFKVDTPASNYGIEIYRMGYYDGSGARRVASFSPSASLPQSQPDCLTSASTGLVDCGNWAISASWTVPADAVSGIYFAKLTRFDTGGESHIFFIVRESDTAAHKSKMLFQTSDTTWQAYNRYGGNSLYVGSPAGRAYKVSYNRPITTRSTGPEDFVFNAEYPMVRFMESNGYDVSYISGVDSDRFGTTILTPSKHQVFLSVGHDEYWSGAQRANVEAARAAGMHLAFFSGNEVFWKTRWENSIDSSNTPYRTLVCYKETHAGGVIDPQAPTWTGTWRDARFSPPGDGGKPENALTGQLFMVNGVASDPLTIPAANGKMRFWRNTTVATLATGATATLPTGTLGYEWDGDIDNGFRPNGLIELSSTTINVAGRLIDNGSSFAPGSVNHKLSLYKHTSGALVFGAGTIQWTWGLDSNHDRAGMATDIRMRQATVNLFADMGAQPDTLQSGLVASSASTDFTAPTSVITLPAAGSSFSSGSAVTISGTASDAGGGQLAGVEVSVDGGTKWLKASGTTSWSYTWTAAGSGPVTIRSRAFDDSGNMESPSAGRTINIGASWACPCSVWSPSTVPPAPLDDDDSASLELGMRFQAETAGFVTAVRFYKNALNTGTHTGTLWSSAGANLGTVTFTNETASGWQQQNFPAPIPVAANTTYTISYHAPNGHYTGTDPFFTSAVNSPPLHALADGASGANGVFAYNPAITFPNSTWNSENYWVDLVFTTSSPAPDTTPPTVTLVSPASGATSVSASTTVTATFNEALNASTVGSSTFELRTPTNALVSATVSYDVANNRATLTPLASLATATVYTATVRGGGADPRIKDSAGNALAANVTWSFTTSAAADTTPPTVTVVSPASGATTVSVSTTVTATFSEAMNASTVGASTFELRTPTNALVSATVSYDAANNRATLTPLASLATATVYTATVRGGGTDPRVKDTAGNALASNMTWSFTTASTPPPSFPCPCTIWSPTAVPSQIDDGDPAAVDVGTKFRADVAGYVTGARFYKAPLNTGVHVATLWAMNGTALGSAAFTNETASGWQETAFSPPIAIAANTTYIISYRAPNGHYTGVDNYFQSTGVTNAPLRALRNGDDGPNGVYYFGSTTGFPNQTWMSEGYYVDVVFNTSVGADTQPPAVSSVTPSAGANGVSTTVAPTVTFNEALNAATVNASTFILRNASSQTVPAAVSYDSVSRTVTLTPSAALANSATYSVLVEGGTADPRVKDVAGNALAADYTWSFTTTAPPPPPPTQGPGGPILVITGSSNPFTVYYAEILRNEGFNAFFVQDLSTVSAATLATYDVVILGETPLSSSQVSMLTTWVNGGGNLVAMRPDKQLAGLMGLTDAGTTLSNAYLLVSTGAAPGAGIVNQTIQFHGTADRYTLNGATSVATLYSTASASTSSPAVTTRQVGSGRAVAFTFDLARSVVYTRQGNPAWSGQDRDAQPPIRSDDLFFGARSGDVQPDWVDLNKVQIPQADEQQRLLANIILQVNASKKPLPRFWYLPRMLKAAVVMTGDDHGTNGTAPRFDSYLTSSAAGCSVADWQCIRGTSYIYPSTPISAAAAQNYANLGFELAVHVNTNCNDYTAATLPAIFSSQLSQFGSTFPGVPTPRTNRTHCIVWSDYTTQAQVSLDNGIRLDTNYYYWPGTWVLDRPGMFTGSGMPMRFATSTGQMIDVYQAATQMTDESGQSFPMTINTLLDNALGSLGYYGVFTANMHTDFEPVSVQGSNAIVASAQARGVPVVTAKQMLDWLDGRNASSFQSIAWNANVLSFTVAVGAGANGLHAMVPASTGSSPIIGVTRNGATVAHTLQTIKGVQYAVFPSAAGNYLVSYGVPDPPPIISGLAATSIGTTSATITWTTNEASTTVVHYGTDPVTVPQTASNSSMVTSHSSTLSGLLPNTLYYYRAESVDAGSNPALSPAGDPPASFSTLAPFISGSITPAASGSGATVALSGTSTASTTANGSGAYTFNGLSAGGYTVTPSRTGYTFSPTSQSVTVSSAGVSGVNFTASPVVISGTITGAGGSGAVLALSGSGSGSATADASGVFSFSAVANGSYVVTPSRAGYTFAPASLNVVVSGGSVTGLSFASQSVTVSGGVSPAASGSGATLTLTGPATIAATANGTGAFSLGPVPNGSYTLTPSKSGFTFSPSSQPVVVSGASISGLSFTATAIPTYTISGTITPAATGASASVSLTGAASATTTADASGNFTFSGLLNGSYTVTPTKSGVTFTPASQAVTVSSANATANFTAAEAAIIIDATVTFGRSTSSNSITSPAVTTTTGNQLLLAFVSAGRITGTTSVSSVTGAGLTWQLVRRTNTQRGTSEIWRAFATSTVGAQTVRANLSQSVAASITVMSFRGVSTAGTNGSGAIGATASGNANPGAPTATLVTTRANSLVIGVGNDWDTATSRTIGSGQTMVSQYLATTSGDTFWVQRRTSATPTAGTSVTINDTAPTGDRYNLTICEILVP